jgi:uncharacterized membrane protein YfcA
MDGNWECVCEASIEWSPAQLIFCAFCGLLGGTVGGLLGSGGGFILGPLLLELGCIPQVFYIIFISCGSVSNVIQIIILKKINFHLIVFKLVSCF